MTTQDILPEQLLLDHSGEMLLAVDPETMRIAAANRCAEDTLGYARGGLIGLSIGELENALADLFYWEEVRQGSRGDIDDVESLYHCADGSLLPVVKSIRRVSHEGREWLMLRIRDERRIQRLAASMARATAQLQATLEATGDGILVLDTNGRIVRMNHRCGRLWSIPLRLPSLNAEEISAWMQGQLADPGQHPFGQQRDTQDPSQESVEILTLANGKVFERRTRPQLENDQVTGHVLSFHDITEQVAAERDLIEARERAESASRAKSDFLAMISHEIRTPMNGVLGMASLLLETELDFEQQRLAETIRSSGGALLAIINDILDFSKIEARKLTLETIDFNLYALLEQFVEPHAVRAAQKQLEFSWSIGETAPVLLRGDPGRIRQILDNLIGNAIKFTDRGEIALRIDCPRMSANGAELLFTVSDTGIGIPADRVDAIFQPFEQADKSTTRRYGGTGLGLAITVQLVELMGGKITAESEEGKGSSFRFNLSMERQAEGAVSSRLPGEERLASVAGTRILLVTRNEHVRRRLGAALSAWGFAVSTVEDSQRAISALGEALQGDAAFRIVLIDEPAGGGEGEQLGRTIRQQHEFAATSLVLMSATGYRGDAQRLTDSGFSGYLPKPVRRNLLLGCILSILSESDNAAARLVTRHSIAESRHRDERILLAEDNRTNQTVVLAMLRKLGFRAIDVAADGQQALDLALAARYDLILMDCLMPNIDGYSATRALRQRGIATPVIAISANTLPEDQAKCLAAGMNAHVGKPIAFDTLAAEIDRWLDGSRGPQAFDAGN